MSVSVIFLMIGMTATLLVLLAGLFGMATGGDFNRKYSNKLMSARVACQAFTLLMFVIVLATR